MAESMTADSCGGFHTIGTLCRNKRKRHRTETGGEGVAEDGPLRGGGRQGELQADGAAPPPLFRSVSILSFSVLCAFIQNGEKENACKREGGIRCV